VSTFSLYMGRAGGSAHVLSHTRNTGIAGCTMRRAFQVILILTSMVVLEGCTPVLMVYAGIEACLAIDQGIKKQECARKAALERERVGQENLTRQRSEELRRQQLAATQRQTDAADANALLINIESDLNAGRWNKQRVSGLREAISAADRSTAPDATRACLHIATGLYAYLSGDEAGAEKEWTLARRMGAREARVVASDVWTPGAVEAFARAARD